MMQVLDSKVLICRCKQQCKKFAVCFHVPFNFQMIENRHPSQKEHPIFKGISDLKFLEFEQHLYFVGSVNLIVEASNGKVLAVSCLFDR